ncbi:MAG: FG-GAP repeat domain-containing protein, partial [Planctomycetota bacterium]
MALTTAAALLVGAASAFGPPAAEPPSGSSPEPSGRFVNVAPEAGVNAVLYCGGAEKDHILESVGCGVAFVDYDDDGWLDVYLINAWALEEEPSRVRIRSGNALYRNLGNGRFEHVIEAAGLGDDGWGCGVCAGDYDGDGRIDLYVTNFGPNRLYRNRGDGTFDEVAAEAGVAEPGWGAGAALFDADGDGDLDLYVANYIDCTMDEVLSARRTN